MIHPPSTYSAGLKALLLSSKPELAGCKITTMVRAISTVGAIPTVELEFRIDTEDPDIFIVLGEVTLEVGNTVTLIEVTKSLEVKIT